MHFRMAALFMLLAAASVAPAPLCADSPPDQLQKLVDADASAIVTVRVVVKIDVKEGGQSQSVESRMVTEGVVVSPDGLVMLSNAPISSDVWKQMSGSDEDRSDLSIRPSEFKVMFDREDKEYDAFLAATDSRLGLAFIKIRDLGGRKLSVVDFQSPAPVGVGDTVASLTRLGKGYDYVPICQTARVAGEITKPCRAWMVGGDITGVGLPVFSPAGDTVGVMTLLPTEVGETDGGGLDMTRFFGGSASDHMGIFMIPAQTIQNVVAEAQKQASSVSEDHFPTSPTLPPPTAAVVAPVHATALGR
ncbi:MAG: hypothetical protein ACLQVD_05145 [Capsulimonadaceae bacterium]